MILALVTKSANDIAAVVAEHLAGSEARFAWSMTTKAHEIGMSRTTFTNASGLPDPVQVTTARDMAMLGLALLHDYPHYYHYFSTDRFYYGGAVHANTTDYSSRTPVSMESKQATPPRPGSILSLPPCAMASASSALFSERARQ